MPSTTPLKPSTRLLKAPRQETAIPTPKPTKRLPLTSQHAFVAAHRNDEKRLAEYVARGRKGSVRLDQAILDELDPAAALYLYANNMDARIAFAAVAKRHVEGLFARHSGTFFWVTFIPKQFVVPENEAAGFEFEEVQRWANNALKGLSYLGIVEPAFYTNVGALLGGHQRAVSWHAHLLVWGVDAEAIQKIMEDLNRRFMAFLPGVVPALAVPISDEEVVEKLLYMLKAPQSNYRVYPMKREVQDPITGELTAQTTGFFRQKKGELRPGEMSRMCKVLAGKCLDRLAFASGEGKAVLTGIRREALQPLRRERSRQASLQAFKDGFSVRSRRL